MEPVYLGDAVYASFDGLHIVLTANPGSDAENVVYLDGNVYAALVRFEEGLRAQSDDEGSAT
jgi:hypothetical protein